jgi:hypothetical protein
MQGRYVFGMAPSRLPVIYTPHALDSNKSKASFRSLRTIPSQITNLYKFDQTGIVPRRIPGLFLANLT